MLDDADAAPFAVSPDLRLASIESRALVSAVASVAEMVPAEASLSISEATRFLWACAGRCGAWICEAVVLEIELMGGFPVKLPETPGRGSVCKVPTPRLRICSP